MSRFVQINIFNDLMDQFLNYLEINFPLFRSDIILSRTAVQMLRKGSPRILAEQFMKYVLPYKQQIVNCNEDFFLNFEKNMNSNTLTNDNILIGLKIKNMWMSSDITDKQKAYIWYYFQQLIRSGERVLL